MLPSARVVLEDPLLNRVSLDCEAWRRVATTHQLTVYLPLAVTTLEPEGASNAWRVVGVWKSVEIRPGWNGRGVDTVVRHDRTVNDDLQDLVALSGAQNIAGRTASVFLLQAILEEECLSGVVREINDY